jgi:hypothetical protein
MGTTRSDLIYGQAIGLLERLFSKAAIDSANVRIVPSTAMKLALCLLKDGRKRKRLPNIDALKNLTINDFGTIDGPVRTFRLPQSEVLCYICKKTHIHCNYDECLAGYDSEWKLRHHGKVIYQLSLTDLYCRRCTMLDRMGRELKILPQCLLVLCVEYEAF